MRDEKPGILGFFRNIRGKYLIQRMATGTAVAVFGLVVLALSVMAVVSPVRVLPYERPVNDYVLPYPGLLPDRPLYKLKVLRDWSRLLLASDEDKAWVALELADKRMVAAVALGEVSKHRQALEAAMKAESYLSKSVEGVKELQARGYDMKSLLGVLEKAIAKHGELLGELSKFATGTEGKYWENQIAQNQFLGERVKRTLAEAK